MNRLLKVATLTLLFASTLIMKAQTLRVQILNGKNGKPVANEHVNLFRNGDFADPAGNYNVPGFGTDAAGIFTVSQIAPDTRSFAVYVDWHKPCATKRTTFSMQDIFSKGIVSENSCKAKVGRIAEPGTLILFVRNETFFEKMAH